MNSSDLVALLSSGHGLNKSDAKKIVDGLLGAIVEAARRGDEIALNGFGKFKVKSVPAREGRNPATGAAIKIAAAKKLTFSAAKTVKDKLNR